MDMLKLLGAAGLAASLFAAPVFAQHSSNSNDTSANFAKLAHSQLPTGPQAPEGVNYGNNNGTGGFAQPIYGGPAAIGNHTGAWEPSYNDNRVTAGHVGGFVDNNGTHYGGFVHSNGHTGGFANENGTHTGGFVHNTGAHPGGFVNSGAHTGSFVNDEGTHYGGFVHNQGTHNGSFANEGGHNG